MLQGFPRTRGDVPGARFVAVTHPRLPPHTRGCTRHGVSARAFYSASPAHAGMYPMMVARTKNESRFPRTRGDVPRI